MNHPYIRIVMTAFRLSLNIFSRDRRALAALRSSEVMPGSLFRPWAALRSGGMMLNILFRPWEALCDRSPALCRLSFCLTLLLWISIAGVSDVKAGQVFDVTVEVNTSQISTTDYDYLRELGPLIREYLETNSWTEDRFEEQERIKVSLQIVINSVEQRRFHASMIISTERPVYNTMQVTPLLIVNENNWNFEFNRGQSLLHDTYQYHDIASVLDFYAYLILGFDYDTFSEMGGEEFFRSARRIADMGQTSGSDWTSSAHSRSRHDLVSQVLNPNYESFRKALYQYHRHGLDLFIAQPDRSRDHILESFEMIREAQRQTTERYLFDLLFTAKHREFRAIFMDADTQRRLEAYNLLTTIDDSRISEYERLQR